MGFDKKLFSHWVALCIGRLLEFRAENYTCEALVRVALNCKGVAKKLWYDSALLLAPKQQ
jgi:hypothetical protein